MAHDFKKFPELTTSQMQFYYWESPHKQIFRSFNATVTKVTDGDTVRVMADFRDFDFKVRLARIAAPELSEGGQEAKSWLEKRIEGDEVMIIVDPNNRVGKWGRLIGDILHGGVSVNDELINKGLALPFDQRGEGRIPSISKFFKPLQ